VKRDIRLFEPSEVRIRSQREIVAKKILGAPARRLVSPLHFCHPPQDRTAVLTIRATLGRAGESGRREA
jgi:hypothetical protein